jgi:signal transduction histidine kinase
VVAELVSRMGGDVAVDDAPSGGARVTVRLPAATTDVLEEVADATTT